MRLALVVGVAGALGALARYLVDGAVQDRSRGAFPYGTTVVNVTGSFVLGLISSLAWHHGLGSTARAVIGAGFCGAFTTWSTAAWETVRLAEEGLPAHAAMNALGGLAGALAAAAAGIALGAL